MKFPLPCVLYAALCSAATTQTWELNGYSDFSKGRMGGLSLTREGKLAPGPRVTTVFDSSQAEIWSAAASSDGSIYLGTGNRGRLYRVDPAGKSSLVWTSDQPEIFAVAVDAKGAVYAGTSPDGKVYRIENGKAAEYFSPGAHYIWALAAAADGSLYVATGDEGKIFRVTSAGQGSVYYETGQAHVTVLAFDTQGRLLAGSEPNGLVYRITAPGKAFVLYDSSLPEIRAIASSRDGSLYVAALGGSVAKRVGAASSAGIGSAGAIPTISTTVTVTDQQGGLNSAPKPEPSKPAAASVSSGAVATASAGSELAGVERSALYKIAPDNTVETLWSSKEENIYDVALQDSSIIFLTDTDGRIYRMQAASPNGPTLLAQANEGDANRLLASPQGLLAITGNLGKLLRLDNGAAAQGWFESPIHDAGAVARWGRLSWRGSTAGVAFRTRTGNSSRPDSTWSDWSNPMTSQAQSAVTSPNARYIQWRAELSPSSGGSPEIDDVIVAYLPQNTPPGVRTIAVTPVAGAAKAAAAGSSSASYSVTVTDTPDATPAGTSSQSISRGSGQQLQISWQADDADGDKLIYNVYFRGEDETQWKLLRANLTEANYTLDGDVLADGRYFFRVTASDRPSNPVNLAREAELVSSPVVIDNTPPVVTVGTPRKNGSALEIEVQAEDKASSLRRCEYSVDAGPWTPVEAADGVTDSPSETFPLRLEGFPTGEHLISIRVYDAAGNAGLAKLVIR